MKHDDYARKLASRIVKDYDIVITDYEIQEKGRKQAQADILGIKDGIIDIYEVKCSYRIHKAAKQLKRLKRLTNASHTYFYCGSSGQLLELQI